MKEKKFKGETIIYDDSDSDSEDASNDNEYFDKEQEEQLREGEEEEEERSLDDNDDEEEEPNEASVGEESNTTAGQAEQIRKQLANVPFSTLLKTQLNGKDALHRRGVSKPAGATNKGGNATKRATLAEKMAIQKQLAKERKSHSAPAVLSSKFPVGRFRQVVSMPQNPTRRDPRFDDLSGKYHKESFNKSYAFLGDYRQAEIDRLRKDESDPENKRALAKIMTQVGEEKRQKKEQEARKLVRTMNRERVKKGLAPVYVSRGKVKELSQSVGKKTKKDEERHMKRRAAKDRNKMPTRRNFKE